MGAERVQATEFFELTIFFVIVDFLNTAFESATKVVVGTVEEEGLVDF